jgi:hypothetical protein
MNFPPVLVIVQGAKYIDSRFGLQAEEKDIDGQTYSAPEKIHRNRLKDTPQ